MSSRGEKHILVRDLDDAMHDISSNTGRSTHTSSKLRTVDVVIIGGGFSGCYLLHKLRQQNFSAIIVEAASGLGGVWQWNCYPGARVDTPVPLYEYSIEEVWKTFVWKEKLPTASELQRYFQHVDEVLGLSKDVLYNTRATRAVFDDDSNKWTITTDKDFLIQARWFIPAVGFAAKRSFPNWPGLDNFQGAIHHSSFWPHEEIDLHNKRVAIVGTGSTGVQLVQELGPRVQSLKLLQRTLNMALPLNQATLTKEMQEKDKLNYPAKHAERLQSKGGYDFSPHDINTFDHTHEERQAFYEDKWVKGGFHFWVGSYNDILTDINANNEAYKFWVAKIRNLVKDTQKQDLLAPLHPPHPFGTKRPALFRNFYEVCGQDNVQIIDINRTPVTKVVPTGFVTADGISHEIDALILATGFDAITGGLKAIDIRNGQGKALSEMWASGTWTNLGLMTAGFPNMFFMYGPQGPTALSNGPTCIEIQGDWIVDALLRSRESKKQRMATTREAQEKYRELVNELTAKTLFPLANSYYMGANVEGKPREALNYPAGVPAYRDMLRENVMNGYEGFEME